eukprot:5274242-Amphidinium_carterae.2
MILQDTSEELANLQLEFSSRSAPTHAPRAVLCRKKSHRVDIATNGAVPVSVHKLDWMEALNRWANSFWEEELGRVYEQYGAAVSKAKTTTGFCNYLFLNITIIDGITVQNGLNTVLSAMGKQAEVGMSELESCRLGVSAVLNASSVGVNPAVLLASQVVLASDKPNPGSSASSATARYADRSGIFDDCFDDTCSCKGLRLLRAINPPVRWVQWHSGVASGLYHARAKRYPITKACRTASK